MNQTKNTQTTQAVLDALQDAAGEIRAVAAANKAIIDPATRGTFEWNKAMAEYVGMMKAAELIDKQINALKA